jgi:hypothetical protein
MKLRATIFLTTLLVVGLAVGAQATNYIVNGGFETGDYTGWASGGCGPFGVTTSFAGWGPHSGSYFSVEGGVGCDHTLSQTFADVAGQGLTIDFWYGSDGAAFNDLNVYWNGSLIYNLTNAGDTLPNYVEYSFNVAATGSDTLTIGIRNDPAWQALDDVSVTGTPEPGTLMLLGSGVIGLAGVLRRKLML